MSLTNSTMKTSSHNSALTDALLQAAKEGKYKDMITALENGADPNVVDENGEGLLYLAAKRAGGYQIAKALLDKGASANIRDKHGVPPLWYACRDTAITPNQNTVELLLSVTDPELIKAAHKISQETALHRVAAITEYSINIWKGISVAPIVQQLISKGASTSARDNAGATPLWRACEAGSLIAAQILLSSTDSEFINVVSGPDRQTVLHVAVRKPHLFPIIKELLDKGCDPNIPDKKHLPALFYACLFHNLKAAQLLLPLTKRELCQVANPFSGQTLLHLAATSPTLNPLVNPLLVAGADLSALSKGGQTPLLAACASDNLEAARLILSRTDRELIDVADSDGRTALHYVANRPILSTLIGPLLAKGADPFLIEELRLKKLLEKSLEQVRADYPLPLHSLAHLALRGAATIAEVGTSVRAMNRAGGTIGHVSAHGTFRDLLMFTREIVNYARICCSKSINPNEKIAATEETIQFVRGPYEVKEVDSTTLFVDTCLTALRRAVATLLTSNLHLNLLTEALHDCTIPQPIADGILDACSLSVLYKALLPSARDRSTSIVAALTLNSLPPELTRSVLRYERDPHPVEMIAIKMIAENTAVAEAFLERIKDYQTVKFTEDAVGKLQYTARSITTGEATGDRIRKGIARVREKIKKGEPLNAQESRVALAYGKPAIVEEVSDDADKKNIGASTAASVSRPLVSAGQATASPSHPSKPAEPTGPAASPSKTQSTALTLEQPENHTKS